MSGNTSFHFDSYADSVSTSVGGESDREPIVVDALDETYFSRCYWSGKSFLNYVLSDAVFQTAPAKWSGIELESEVSQAVINFPYSDCVEQIDALRAIIVPDDRSRHPHGGHWMFLTKLGAVLDREPELKAKLTSIIQTRGGTIPFRADPNRTFPPSPPGTPDNGIEEGSRLAMYTMKLYEWCTQKVMNISYDDEQLNIDPPHWQVNVRVDGRTFSGRAKKKAKAKHIASKQACEELRINV